MAKNWRETISFYSNVFSVQNLIWTYAFNMQSGENGTRINGVYVRPTQYTRQRRSHRSGYVSYISHKTGQFWNALRVECRNLGPWIDYKDYNTLLREAKIRMVNNIDGAMLAHDFVEACSQTTSFFKRIPGTIRLLKKKKYRQALAFINGSRTARKSIPDTYLAFVFGVKPMIQEICETWEHLKDPKAYTFKLTSSASDKRQVKARQVILNWYGCPISGESEFTIESKVKCYRYFRDNAYDDLNGVSLNPVPAIWDSIPYSFMVDWFLPIQPIINGMSYSGVKAISGCNCYLYREEGKLEVDPISVGKDYTAYGHNPDKSIDFAFRRYIDSTVGLSLDEAKAHINAQLNLSKSKLLSAFAIAWQHCIK